MSRGPGHVEKAIETAFASSPDQAFSTDDLVMLTFSIRNRVLITKSDRVSVLRAAHKVAKRMHWDTMPCARLFVEERGLIFFNRHNVMSYARCRQRAMGAGGDEASLAPGGKDHHFVAPNGTWWMFVEQWKCEDAGVPPGPELQALIDAHKAFLDGLGAKLENALSRVV